MAAESASAEGREACVARVSALQGAHYLTLQQQYGLMLATDTVAKKAAEAAERAGEKATDAVRSTKLRTESFGGSAAGASSGAGASGEAGGDELGVYIVSMEMDGAGASSGLLSPDDRVLEVGGVRAQSLTQVTDVFRSSRGSVTVKVKSDVVHGGMLLKKGELNTSLQQRWFMLSDEGDASVLRYYDGRNAVSRVLKGEILISPSEVSSVRTFTHEVAGQKRLGVRIATAARTWELVAPRQDTDARQWAELLNARIRPRARHSTSAGKSSKEAGIVSRSHRP
ncbi:MAG: PDZ domain-containing protein, partial [Actinomycetota bacterium]|nr:PDZ domain-containing protein [Actinomycetota bacterium]